MEKYRVKALSVAGRRNRIHHVNEEVNEENFPDGVAKDLERKGFLEKLGVDEVKPKFEPEPPKIIHKEEPKMVGMDEVTRKDMMKDLKKRGISFQTNASKEELFGLWSKK